MKDLRVKQDIITKYNKKKNFRQYYLHETQVIRIDFKQSDAKIHIKFLFNTPIYSNQQNFSLKVLKKCKKFKLLRASRCDPTLKGLKFNNRG